MTRFFLFGIDTGLAALFGVTVIIAAARSLTLAEVGHLSLIVALVTLQVPIATMGLDSLLYARLSRNKLLPLPVIRHLFGPVLISGTVIFLLGIITATAINGSNFALVYACGACRLVFSFSDVVRAGFRARRRPESFILARIFSTTVSFSMVAGTFFLDASVALFATIWSLEYILFSIFLLFQHIKLFSLRLRVRAFKVSIYKSFPSLIQMASIGFYYRFDQVYVSLLFSPEELAVYAVGARVAEAGNMLFALFGFVVAPLIIDSFRRRSEIKSVRRFGIAFFIFSAIFIGLVWATGSQIAVFVFGKDYEEVGGILMIYSISVPFTVLGFIGTSLALAYGAYLAPMVSGLVTVIVCFFSTVILVEFFGLHGAAYATVISYATAAGTIWFLALLRIKSTEVR